MRFKRKWDCGICNQPVIADFDTGMITCGCRPIRIPQWVLVDPYQKKVMLKNYDLIMEEKTCSKKFS